MERVVVDAQTHRVQFDGRAPGARPRLDRRRSGNRKDARGARLRDAPRSRVPAHSVYARSHARRRRRYDGFQSEDDRVHDALGADRRERRPGRRGEPHAAEDASRVAGGDGRGLRHHRRRRARAAVAVPALRDAKPDRIRRNVPAAGGATRPLHGEDRLDVSGGRARNRTARTRCRRVRRTRAGIVGHRRGDRRRQKCSPRNVPFAKCICRAESASTCTASSRRRVPISV